VRGQSAPAMYARMDDRVFAVFSRIVLPFESVVHPRVPDLGYAIALGAVSAW